MTPESHCLTTGNQGDVVVVTVPAPLAKLHFFQWWKQRGGRTQGISDLAFGSSAQNATSRVLGSCPISPGDSECILTSKAFFPQRLGPHPHWKQQPRHDAQRHKMEPDPNCARHVLLSVQCVQPCCYNRICASYLLRVASSVDGTLAMQCELVFQVALENDATALKPNVLEHVRWSTQ